MAAPPSHPSDGERLLSALQRVEDLCVREGRTVRWRNMDLVVFAWFHSADVELEVVEPDTGSRTLHVGGEVVVFDPRRPIRPWRLLSAEVWAISADLRDLLDERGPKLPRSYVATMTTLHPSIDIDIDLNDEALTTLEDEERRFEAFLRTVPGQASGRPPYIAFKDDEDDAAYLRGTVWLAAYSEDLASAVQECALAWAAEHQLDCQVHF